jgi:hypothetical protein
LVFKLVQEKDSLISSIIRPQKWLEG